MVEMSYNGKEKSLEVSVRTFTEDLETCLRKNNPGKKTDLAAKGKDEQTENDHQIAAYMTKNLSIRADGKALTLSFLGHDIHGESVWSYLESKDLSSPPKKIDLECSLLYDGFDKQIIIARIRSEGKDKSGKLACPERKLTVVL